MIIDYEYYSALYDDLKQENFIKYETMAEQRIRETMGLIRFSEITTTITGYDVLRDCARNTIHFIIDNETAAGRQGLKSVSNDGYSETYAEQTESEKNKELQNMIKTWLAGSGLLGAY